MDFIIWSLDVNILIIEVGKGEIFEKRGKCGFFFYVREQSNKDDCLGVVNEVIFDIGLQYDIEK